MITGRDVNKLIDILSNDLRGVSRFDVTADDEANSPSRARRQGHWGPVSPRR